MHEVYKIIPEPIARVLFPYPLMRIIIVKRIKLNNGDLKIFVKSHRITMATSMSVVLVPSYVYSVAVVSSWQEGA